MISGIITISAFVAFLLVLGWAVWPQNKSRFDEAAQLPLVDDITPEPKGERQP